MLIPCFLIMWRSLFDLVENVTMHFTHLNGLWPFVSWSTSVNNFEKWLRLAVYVTMMIVMMMLMTVKTKWMCEGLRKAMTTTDLCEWVGAFWENWSKEKHVGRSGTWVCGGNPSRSSCDHSTCSSSTSDWNSRHSNEISYRSDQPWITKVDLFLLNLLHLLFNTVSYDDYDHHRHHYHHRVRLEKPTFPPVDPTVAGAPMMRLDMIWAIGNEDDEDDDGGWNGDDNEERGIESRLVWWWASLDVLAFLQEGLLLLLLLMMIFIPCSKSAEFGSVFLVMLDWSESFQNGLHFWRIECYNG